MNHKLHGADLLAWREQHGLGQVEMAELLGVARVWLSKIENGHREVSPAIFLRFEALKREPRFTSDGAQFHLPEHALSEDATPYGTPEMLRREITHLQQKALADAGDDVARLGWLLIQTQTHLKTPVEWKKKTPKLPKIVPAPANHQNPDQRGATPGSELAS